MRPLLHLAFLLPVRSESPVLWFLEFLLLVHPDMQQEFLLSPSVLPVWKNPEKQELNSHPQNL